MNITEIVQSAGWKNFMAKLYGLGAAVVIVGAMFKIMHWPGASIMLILGLSTEAVIFMFSAFEPPHEELDWTLVYPELAGMSDPDEMEEFNESALSPGKGRITQDFDELLGGALDQESVNKLNSGIDRLAKTAGNLADITDASVATKEYFNNLKKASDSLHALSDTYVQSNESLKESAVALSNSYLSTADTISKAGNNVVDSYQKLAASIVSEHTSIAAGNKAYDSHLEAINKNLSALNTAYELQLQETNQHLKGTKELYSGLDGMMQSLKDSVEETVKYRSEINKLGQNLGALNTIYGNMLSAMNINQK